MQMFHRSGFRTGPTGRGLGAGAVAVLLSVSPLAAAPLLIEASHERNGSSFVLDFGMGEEGRIPAEIAHTDFDLEIDSAAGTAMFRNYFQTIDSLNLFGVETGDIEVRIVASLSGELRPDGTFDTVDTYEIRYFRDLSALGLEPADPSNPDLGGTVELTSASSGHLEIQPDTTGLAVLRWEGSSELNTLMGIFPFSYVCSMQAVFAVTAPSYISLELSPLLDSTPMPANLRAVLAGLLDDAARAFQAADLRGCVRSLNQFVQQVQRAGSAIAPSDALALIIGARTAIGIVQHPQLLPTRLTTPKGSKRAPTTPE